MWWIFSVQDMRCIVLYIRIYTGKSLHFMCCSRVQWTELIMSIIFLYLYYEYFPQEYTLYSSVLHLRKFILKITHVLCHQCFKMQYSFFPFYYCYRSLLSSPPPPQKKSYKLKILKRSIYRYSWIFIRYLGGHLYEIRPLVKVFTCRFPNLSL